MRSIALLAGTAIACGGAQSTPRELGAMDRAAARDVERLEAEHGGPAGLMQFFDDHPDAQITAALRAHGMGFSREPLTACAPTFPFVARHSWHAFDGEFYFIEEHGRPNRAYKFLPPIAKAPRIEGCQRAVGEWGDEEDSSNDYDGGHLIGSQLGGYGGRVNLVPQDMNFNRGNWLRIENQAAACGALRDERISYLVRAEYADAASLVPVRMNLTLENRDTGDSMSFTFDNVDGGGPWGATQRADAVAFLVAQGCQ